MKRLILVIFLCTGIGCTQNARRILPPLYEQYYPLVIGVRSYEEVAVECADSMLAGILIGSSFSAGVLEEPFDISMVDIILEIDELTVTSRTSGFIPRRCELHGTMTVHMLRSDGSSIARYSADAKLEQSSLNPFYNFGDTRILCAELMTSIIDDIDEDFQEEQPAVVHAMRVEEKAFKSEAYLEYPTLTHFSRNGIFAMAKITGEIPLSEVRLKVGLEDGDGLFSKQLYYERTDAKNGTKEWLYQLQVGDKPLPFGKELAYEIESIDAMGVHDTISQGTLHTISRGMYRLKQAEVITHGTIITAFGGLFVVMMLYSM